MIDPHISDSELIQSLDGELDPSGITQHLSHCWTCRARRQQLEQTIAALVAARPVLDIPPVAGPAALLQARMREDAQRPTRASSAVPIAAAIAAGLGVLFLILPTTSSERALPNSRLTPGAVRTVSREQVCASAVRPVRVDAQLAGQVFLEYGIDHPRPKAYEVDYLITPALGGAADDIHNLWPQPYAGSQWTAPVKDALESYLVEQVCEGNMDLSTAQREIASNWIAAYRKHFHTTRPLPAHLAAATDNPWE